MKNEFNIYFLITCFLLQSCVGQSIVCETDSFTGKYWCSESPGVVPTRMTLLVIFAATGLGVMFFFIHEKRMAVLFFLWTLTLLLFYLIEDIPILKNMSMGIWYFLIFVDIFLYYLLMGNQAMDPFGDIRIHNQWLKAEKEKILKAKALREKTLGLSNASNKKEKKKSKFNIVTWISPSKKYEMK